MQSQTFPRAVFRLITAFGAALLLTTAAVGAIALYQRSQTEHPAGRQAQLDYSVQRLRDIRTIMVGARFPMHRSTCRTYALRVQKLGLQQLPPRDSADWNYVLAACAQLNP